MITNPLLPNSNTIAASPTNYFNQVIKGIISIFMFVAVIYFIWHIVFAGYHLIASQGDPKKIESAKNEITHSLLGLGVVFSVFAILSFVRIIFGIPGLKELKITWPTI